MEVTTQLNITTVLTVVSLSIVLGGIIWRLAGKITKLETKIETLETHTDERLKIVDNEIKHVLQVINIRLQITDDKDKQILDTLSILSLDMKHMTTSISDIKTANEVAKAVSEERVRKS